MGTCISNDTVTDENKTEKKQLDKVMEENESYDQMNTEFKNQQGNQGLDWDVNQKFNPNGGNKGRPRRRAWI